MRFRFTKILDFFTTPVRLTDQCGHNFCQKCLVQVCEGRHEWKCPECRTSQNKRPGRLARNRFVEKAVQAFKETALIDISTSSSFK